MKNKSPLVIIFLTVFIDLIGFGIIIPLSPYIAKQFGASGVEIGILQASYSLMQFLFSPFWGRLSDKHGRRPIILTSLIGCGLSYILFAFSSSFWMLVFARCLAGFFGGNISAASAYIADITPPESRSKNLGLIGAAFGLGFVFGPVIGGVLSDIGPQISDQAPFGIGFAALGAGVLCLANSVFAFFSLKESNRFTGTVRPRVHRIKLLISYLTQKTMARLMITFLLSGLAMAHMESMLFLFVNDKFAWSLKQASFGFAYVGVMIVFTQGYLIRKIIPKFGERNVLFTGLCMSAVGIFTIGLASNIPMLAISNTLLALGIGMVNPSTLGSISLLASKDDQGGTLGVTQSLSALGRIVGPVSGGYLYSSVGSSSPFFMGGIFMFIGLLILLPVFSQLPQSGKSSASTAH